MSQPIEHGDKLHTIIPPEHQSAPKETDADKAVRLAAQEAYEGKWVPPDAQTALDDVNIALAAGPRQHVKRVAEGATFEDFQQTRESLQLGQHPRVIEALAKLEQEKRTARTPQEYLEKTAMLFELNASSRRGQHWDGEERWKGADNEEMRRGTILQPMEFYRRLQKVISPGAEMALRTFRINGQPVPTVGSGRLLMGRNAMRIGDQGARRVPLYALMRKKIELIIPGLGPTPDELVYSCSVQYPLATEWMVMRFDEFGVPTSAKHLGWRTALLTMIRVGLITPKEAEKAFPLGSGPASSWYREQLFDWQNNRPEAIN